MNLICPTLLVAVASVLACHESTAPQSETRIYVLQSINGNPLPVVTGAGAGDTLTALWATLTLEPNGNATTIDHYRHVYLAYPAEEKTLAVRLQYRVSRDSITVGWFGQCVDICAWNRVGSITDSSVSLIESYNPYPTPSEVRLYRLIQSY